MNTPRNAVVVGIGADGATSALDFAMAEARRTDRPLHLVHVLQIPAGEAYAGVYAGAVDISRATLAEALERAEQLAGTDVTVTGEVVDNGWVVADLVAAADRGAMLVLQHRAFGPLRRLVTGSVVQSVAGRSRVPVVSVPEGWTPRAEAAAVTAAVQDPHEAPALLRIAFEEARARGTSLVVLHAWWLASGYDALAVDSSVRSTWTGTSQTEIEPVLAPLRAEFADVPVTVRVRQAPAAEAILAASESSDLIVLGRRHHLLPLGSHLGPVARAALGHSTAPVLITPELAVPAVPTGMPELAGSR